LTIEEAGQQLAEKSERVQSIRAKQAEMQTIALGVGRAAARNEAALAEAVLAGGDVAEVLQASAPSDTGMHPAPISPAEARRVLSGLETLLAAALDEEAQAKAALRVARINELKSLLKTEQQQHDALAHQMMRQWAKVTELHSRLAAVTGIQGAGPAWYRMILPRAIPPSYRLNPFETADHWHGTDQILSGQMGNVARSEVAAKLKERGIE